MALVKSKVQVPVGMLTSTFYPITAEPDNAHPTYGAGVDMGAAVKGYLSVTTATASIPGDDITQIEAEEFTGGQLDVETTMSDLEVNATLYGHAYSEEAGEESKSTDASKPGGYSFVEPILKKDKTRIFRATCLYKIVAMASSEKQEADTRKPGELNPKMNAVSFKIMEDNARSWRRRKDFATEAEAHAFIKTVFAGTQTS